MFKRVIPKFTTQLRLFTVFAIVTVLPVSLYSQTNDTVNKNRSYIIYTSYTSVADSLFFKKEYSKSILYYNLAFKAWGNEGYPVHWFRAAIAYSVLNEIDSAFRLLTQVSQKTEYLECDSLKRQEFNVLKADARWDYLKGLICVSNNPALTTLMLRIGADDQGCRNDIDSIGKRFGYVSPQMNKKWVEVRKCDSIDLVRVDSIYSIYGWPGPKLVGEEGSQAFWLVIQHSPLSVQQKYFPIMQQAVKERKATAKNLAYLEDRILMREGKPQKYGTQFEIKQDGVQRLYKLQNKETVNTMRDSVGMPPLSIDVISASEEKK